MSFRTRLTSFFVLIVVVPMLAIGVLVFRLIGDSAQGKAAARASGLASAAASLYVSQVADSRTDARTVARDVAVTPAPELSARLAALAGDTGLERIVVASGSRRLVDIGSRDAVAPGVARLLPARGGAVTVMVSSLTAQDFARQLAGVPGAQMVVRQGSRLLAASSPRLAGATVPASGAWSFAGVNYRAITASLTGFGSAPVRVTVLSDTSTTAASVGSSRLFAVVVIAAFLLLALGFSVLTLRALQGQISRLLSAAKRLGNGDFTAQVPTEGGDEFAALGKEFNKMSGQLSRRLDELSQERTRLRDSIRRIGEAFASNLDQEALRELAVRTAVEAVQATGGHLAVRIDGDGPLHEVVRAGDLQHVEAQISEVEQAALREGVAEADGGKMLAIALRHEDSEADTEGVITVARPDRGFDQEDRDLLRSLASQATMALENVDLHLQVHRQAVTDDLTGLPNHGRFQDLLRAEVEQVRRYRRPLALIMIDLDNFKAVNDSYGHQQGDLVLKQVARVLHDTSRETDTPARYGGEEMALILPHTDLEGSAAIAERIRASIEELSIRRLDGGGQLRITASLGVAAISEGTKDGLIAAADAALYAAKHEGKNRIVRAEPQRANVVRGE